MNQNLDDEIIRWQEKLFKRSLRRACKLKTLETLLGSTSGLNCLEISAGDGTVSSHLRGLGGSWKSAVFSENAAVSLGYSIKDSIVQIEDEKLPFEEGDFDIVVISGLLKSIPNDRNFIFECHRILKSDGWVVLTESYRRPISLVALGQQLLGLSPRAQGAQRNGYTDRELYAILKDGFDVPEIIIYSNGWLESAATLGEWIQKKMFHGPYWKIQKGAAQNLLYPYRKLHALAGFFYPLLWTLSLFEFLPGHKMLVKSRRRPWRPRTVPKLTDGRTITEAAINAKIGTAAPF